MIFKTYIIIFHHNFNKSLRIKVEFQAPNNLVTTMSKLQFSTQNNNGIWKENIELFQSNSTI